MEPQFRRKSGDGSVDAPAVWPFDSGIGTGTLGTLVSDETSPISAGAVVAFFAICHAAELCCRGFHTSVSCAGGSHDCASRVGATPCGWYRVDARASVGRVEHTIGIRNTTFLFCCRLKGVRTKKGYSKVEFESRK